MRAFRRSIPFSLVLVSAVAGCTMAVPRGEAWPPPGTPGDPSGTIGTQPPSEPGMAGVRLAVDRVCRARGVPRGWVATAYVSAGEACPRWRDDDGGYNAAVIERHEGRPVGTRMTVCADQGVPRGWMRETMRDTRVQCVGARVAEGRPTTMVIRRER
jgi:hypothetical protein